MNRLRPGKPGGGNIGFALDKRLKVFIRPSSRNTIRFLMPTGKNREGVRILVDHVIRTWNQLYACRQQYDVVVSGTFIGHVGLGAHAALTTAVTAALNWLYGTPLRDCDLISFVLQNYREPSDGQLRPAFTTGLASFLALYGGFAVLDAELRTVFHAQTPNWNVLVVRPHGVQPKAFGRVELDNTTRLGRRLDVCASVKKMSLVRRELIPAVRRGDLVRVGILVESIQSIGSKRAEIELYGPALLPQLENLRGSGVECVIFSGAGPGIALVSSHPTNRLVGIAARLRLAILHKGRIDNQGVRIATRS